MPDATGPSWKHTGGQAGRPAASRKAWQPGRPQATRGPVDPRARYRRRLIAASVTGAVLVGLVVAVILLWDPFKQPTLVVVAPDAPGSTVAPGNSAGAAGARSFYDEFKDTNDAPKPRVEPNPGVSLANWHDAIDDSSKKPLFLYFACPGAGDASGPYLSLVPSDAAAAKPHRLPVAQVLGHLQTLREKRPKVLILDAATETVSWARGHLHNDFAGRLKQLDAQIKSIPNLVVICSTDDDQRSWVSEEWQQTAFGHYLQQGLKGAAGPPNARLSALDLFKYLEKTVPQWAQANRNAKQQPILLPTQDSDPARDGPTRAGKIVVASLGGDEYKAPGSTEAPGYRFTVPEPLRQEWARYERLEKMNPAPETKAPHLWRQYLDLLLRTEQSARVSGAVPEPAALRLKQLATLLEAPIWPAQPACVPFSLPAAAALGYKRPEEIKPEQFRTFWDHSKPADVWDEMTRRADVDRMRLAISEALVRHLQSTQTPDKAGLDRAEQLLQVVEVGKNRPIETHLVRTFRQYLAPGRDPVLIRLALQVQVEAERAAWFSGVGSDYPYAEQVAAWFRQDLQEADKLRRDGTDLVFAGDVKSAAKARDDLEAAQKKYADLSSKSADLGLAYRVRDRILTRLPYYARWVAGRRMRTEEAKPELERIKDVAARAHQLAALLETPDPSRLDAIRRLVKDLDGPEGLFGKFELDFSTALPRLSDRGVPDNWHALDSALGVPFIPANTRAELLRKLRVVSRSLHDHGDPQNARPDEVVSPRELAQRQGRMALVVLGQARVTEFQGPSLGWDQLHERMGIELGAWWDPVAEAGERIGATFAAIARTAEEKARGKNAETIEGLTQAAALARLMDGATVLGGANPVALERQFRMYQLLIAQARRAEADGWADLDPGSEQPYSLLAARSYITSARAILLGVGAKGKESVLDPRLKAVDEAEIALRYPTFDLEPPKRVYLTDREQLPLRYEVQPKAAPVGYPVIRVSDVTSPLTLRDFPRNEFRSVNEFANPRAEPVEGALNFGVASATGGAKGKVDLQLLFRGRLVKRTVDAEQAEITYHWKYREPPTKGASIAIKGDAALRSGAVAILFDMSGSMRTKEAGQTESRKMRAAKAVEKVLAKMPDATRVSVSTFAGGEQGIIPLFKLDRWSEPEVKANAIFKKLEGKEADGAYTPLADTICQALENEDVLPGKEFTGHRSMIIITDGADTDVNVKPTVDPWKKVVKQLTQGPKAGAGAMPDVAIHLVLFSAGNEAKQAYDQFGPLAARKHYGNSQTTPQLWPSEANFNKGVALVQAEELAEKLKEAMLPTTIVESGDIMRPVPTTIVSDSFWRWLNPTVPPGIYRQTALGFTQEVELRRGERILLEMRQDGGPARFVLPPWASAYGLTRVPRETSKDGTVHLAVSKNSLTQPSNTYDLELTATLERPMESPDRPRLERRLPLFVWFDVSPLDADKDQVPTAIRVENLHYRPAPAWKVSATRWVPMAGKTEVSFAAARSRVDAYWLDSEPQARATLRLAELRDKDAVLTVDDVKVTVDRDAPIKNGELTVRLTHAPNKPVLVRVAGQRWTLREEHRFFDKANQYTAVFEVREEDRDKITLEFFSVATIKDRSRKVALDLPRASTQDSRDELPEYKLTEK